MADTTSLLKLRKDMKKRKPTFLRQDVHKKIRLAAKWRRPRGLQSKVRLQKRGRRASVSTGYQSPKAVRGKHRSGLEAVRISHLNDLARLDPKQHGVVIASSVGTKNKIAINAKAKELGIKVLNGKTVDARAKKIAEQQAARKKARDAKKKDAKKEAKAKDKKTEPKPADAAKKEPPIQETDDEAKKAAKQEKDKVLIKKQ